MPILSRVLPAVLAAVLATTAGCAVLPVAVERSLPPSRAALDGMAEAHDQLTELWPAYEHNFAAAANRRPVAAHGATHAAYQRWVNDEVRELPEVSETVAIAGGDT